MTRYVARPPPTRVFMNQSNATPADGRRNRTVLTRQQIVQAFIALIRQGHVAPTAEDVSARANVGLRTVFRHFEDMETLYREVNTEIRETVSSMLRLPYVASDWRARVNENIAIRCMLYERLTPFFIAAQVHRHESAFIEESIHQGVHLERTILLALLPKEIARDKARFEAIFMTLSPDNWIRLRREQGMTVVTAQQTIGVAVTALLR